MFDRAVLVVALFSAFAFSGTAMACEMHESHATPKTVANEPAPLPPAPAPQVVKEAIEAAPAASTKIEEPMSKRSDAGFVGCPNMRNKSQTVYLTN